MELRKAPKTISVRNVGEGSSRKMMRLNFSKFKKKKMGIAEWLLMDDMYMHLYVLYVSLNSYLFPRCSTGISSFSNSLPSTCKPARRISPALTGPTPFGVPVRTRSPSSSVITWLIALNCLGISKSMRFVLSFCLISPLTLSHRSKLCGSGILDLGIGSEMGRKVSKPLAMDHGRPFFFASS